MKQLKLTTKWSKPLPRANFPMGYDEEQQRIIVGYRVPAKLMVYDSETGKEIFSAPMVGDADDLYWDVKNKCVYISGGGGTVDIFKQTDNTSYKQVAHIKTRDGARTSLLVPGLRLLLIAAKADGDHLAALLVYKTN